MTPVSCVGEHVGNGDRDTWLRAAHASYYSRAMPMIDKPGLQPLRPLLEDAAVTEIMIKGPHQIFVERNGRMVEVPTVFTHRSQLDLLVDNLVVAAGRGVNTRTPMVDFRTASVCGRTASSSVRFEVTRRSRWCTP